MMKRSVGGSLKLNSKTLKKLLERVKSVEKPNQSTLDHLALLAGFQSWEDLQTALHGENDAQLNYDVDSKSV